MALKMAGTTVLKKLWAQGKQHWSEQEQQEAWRRVEGLLREIGCNPDLTGPVPELDPATEDILRSLFIDLFATQGVKTTQAMTRLLAHYVSNGKSLDKFFRRTGKLLVSIDDADLDILHALLQRCLNHREGTSAVAALMLGNEMLRLYRYPGSGDEVHKELVPFESGRDVLDVIRLLKESGFVLEPPGDGDFLPDGPGALLIIVAAWPDIERLATIVQ